jgi:hypothetical protein
MVKMSSLRPSVSLGIVALYVPARPTMSPIARVGTTSRSLDLDAPRPAMKADVLPLAMDLGAPTWRLALASMCYVASNI